MWVKKGKFVTLRGVKHPGTSANPFMMRALKAEMKAYR